MTFEKGKKNSLVEDDAYYFELLTCAMIIYTVALNLMLKRTTKTTNELVQTSDVLITTFCQRKLQGSEKSLFNTSKNGRDSEVRACALSSPLTFLTGDHARVLQIGFYQILPSASSTRDLGTRLPSFQCEANKLS